MPSRLFRMETPSLHVGIACRPMEETDLADVYNIHTSCLQKTLAGHYTLVQIATWQQGHSPQAYWHGVIAGDKYNVAEIEGTVVAFASWRAGELLSLFVSPTKQRSGIGSILLACIDHQAVIKCVKASLNAAAFYRKFGFQAVTVADVNKRGIQIPYILMRRT